MPQASFEVFQCHLKKKGGIGQIADKVQAVIFLPVFVSGGDTPIALPLRAGGQCLLPAC